MASNLSLDRLLTVREAADRLGWKPLKLRRWLGAGRLPCIRVGRTVHIAEGDLVEMIARARVGGAGPLPVDVAVRRLVGKERVF